MTRPFLTRFEAVSLAIAALILVVTLLVPPIVGLADNGDFYKMLSKYDLDHSPTREERYFAYLNTIYIRDPAATAHHRRVWGGKFISSEALFMAVAVRLNGLVHSAEVFHLQFLGLVHIAVLLAAATLLLVRTRGLPPSLRVPAAVLSIVMFLDVGYISYFNSAYTETSSFLFLVLLIAAAAPVLSHRPLTPAWIALYFLFAFLFCCSRYPNALMYPLLALFGLFAAFQSRKTASAAAALAATLLGGHLLLRFVREAPPAYVEFSVYNHFFNGLLPFSPDPARDLEEFGLDPSLQRYSGTTYYQPQSAVYNEQAIAQFREKVSPPAVAKFYMRHPSRAFAAILRTVPRGMSLRPGYGNYEKSAGRPPGSVSHGFAVWSTIRESLLPKSFWAVAIILLISAANALRSRKSLCAVSFRLLPVLLCALQLAMISCTSEFSDIVRHMFLFNMLLDVVLMITAAELLSCLGRRLVGSEVEKEAYPN